MGFYWRHKTDKQTTHQHESSSIFSNVGVFLFLYMFNIVLTFKCCFSLFVSGFPFVYVQLVRLLLHVNERERLTAEELLRHSWITGKSEATDANIPDSLHNNNEDREPLNCVNIAHQQKQDSQLVIPPLEDCE